MHSDILDIRIESQIAKVSPITCLQIHLSLVWDLLGVFFHEIEGTAKTGAGASVLGWTYHRCVGRKDDDCRVIEYFDTFFYN